VKHESIKILYADPKKEWKDPFVIGPISGDQRLVARSRTISLRQGKGVFDDFSFALIRRDDDFDDIESVADFREVEHAQPCDRAASDQFLFLFIDRFGRIAEFACLPGLNFYEDQFVGFQIAADNVDFTSTGRAEVPIENFVAGTLEMPGREVLANPAQVMGLVLSRGRG
jgi:hypothetical protein